MPRLASTARALTGIGKTPVVQDPGPIDPYYGIEVADYTNPTPGSSQVIFSNTAQATNFIFQLNDIIARRNTAAYVTYNPIGVTVFPLSGTFDNVTFEMNDTQALNPVQGGSSVTFDHLFANFNNQSGPPAGDWYINSSGNYTQTNPVIYTYGSNVCTATLDQNIAEQLAVELTDIVFLGQRNLNINGLVGATDTLVYFVDVTDLSGSGSTLMFNYGNAIVIGNFGATPGYIEG